MSQIDSKHYYQNHDSDLNFKAKNLNLKWGSRIIQIGT